MAGQKYPGLAFVLFGAHQSDVFLECKLISSVRYLCIKLYEFK